ncbi:MAG: MFS transporter [Anaerolineae bacterium]|nr:MFS transporter [Anaerolineae bacterium]
MSKVLRNPLLWSLSLSHFSTDLYSGAIAVLMVVIGRSLNLSISEIAVTLATYSYASSLSQPLFGYVGDRLGGKWFVAGGVFTISLFFALLCFANTLSMIIVCVVFAGLGSAAFHPQGASGAAMSGGESKSTAISIFMLGGNIGYAAGPLLAGMILANYNKESAAIMALFGLCMAPFLFKLLSREGIAAKPRTPVKGIPRNRAFSGFAIFALMSIMALRAGASSAMNSLTPQFFGNELGFGIAFGSSLAATQLFGLALGGFAGGMAADRFGQRNVIFISLLLSAPFTALYFLTHSSWVYPIAAVTGFFYGMSWPPLLSMSQELFPKSAGLASGLSLGFVFSMGGLGTTLTGFLAEPYRLGMQNALLLLAPWSFVAALLVLALPTREKINNATQLMNAR